jgi:serine/threonine protein kinase/tetratricopeptide (TPR) repeat protein
MSDNVIKLGPFILQEQVGEGGMGQVWRGLHQTQGIPVAVKVVSHHIVKDPQFIQSFRSEVRAMAGLNHPGIAMVFDQGEISQEAAAASGGKLVAGGPYLVMEYVSKGSLDQVGHVLEWPYLRSVMTVLLNALSHAHARGVIHRDMKPQNVLLSSADDLRPGLKITDFGIAHALDAQTRTGAASLTMGSEESITGSPQYMAPEQLKGHWREYGPWTDLYAVGVMACLLSTGSLPFEGNLIELIMAHLEEAPPRIKTVHPYPGGFEGWVMRLMQKDRHDRFQRAADAASALNALDPSAGGDIQVMIQNMLSIGGGVKETGDMTAPYIDGDNQDAGMTTVNLSGNLPDVTRELSQELPVVDSPQEVLAERNIPPIPVTWREQKKAEPQVRIIDVGLGLYGMRQIPLVDRGQERDLLWHRLCIAAEQRQCQVVVLRGTSGLGKSCLAQWLAQKSYEMGLSEVYKAFHSPEGGKADGVGAMISRNLRCMGLSQADALSRINSWLGQWEVDDSHEGGAILELISSVTSTDTSPVRFSGPTERFASVHRCITRQSNGRVGVVWLDDIQWGASALGLAQYLLDTGSESGPMLIVMTVLDEMLTDRPLESALLTGLLAHERVTSVEVLPLDADHHLQLVNELLPLEQNLAHQVALRTEGNPLFATQLIGDWVNRGVVEVREGGYGFSSHVQGELPDDIYGVWAARIGRILFEIKDSLHGDERLEIEEIDRILQVGAILGHQAILHEWQDVCEQLGYSIPHGLIESLLRNRLAEQVEGGVQFVHRMLRESLQRRAREQGGLEKIHSACAQALQVYYDTVETYRGLRERIARHLFFAGRQTEALEPLLEGAEERRDRGEYKQALALLDLFEEAALTNRATNLPIQGQAWLLRAEICLKRGKADEALKWSNMAKTGALRDEWPKVMTRALIHTAEAYRLQGSWSEALEQLEQVTVLVGDGDPQMLADVDRSAAWCEYRLGQLEAAKIRFESAQQCFVGAGRNMEAADCDQGIALILRLDGRFEEALEHIKSARNHCESGGNRHGLAWCENNLGEQERALGNLRSAAKHYRRAWELFKAIGATRASGFPRLNLCMLQLQSGQFIEASKGAEKLKALFSSTGDDGMLMVTHCVLLPCFIEQGDWNAWDRCWDKIMPLYENTGLVEADVAHIMRMAGKMAQERGRLKEARQAFEWSLSHWQKLNQADESAALEKLLSTLAEE